VDCPLDCEYLRESRRRDKPAAIDLTNAPNQDIPISEKFLQDNQALLMFLSQTLPAAAMAIPGVVDSDVREALDALTRTYRTLHSGLYYESLPDNRLSAALYKKLQDGIAQFRNDETKSLGISKTRDADILGLLVFLQRLELDRNNGRRRGRAFIDVLQSFYPEGNEPAVTAASPLILP
jgi:hypothetical protein